MSIAQARSTAPGPGRAGRPKDAAKRAAILAAAKALFARDGFEHVTMEAVASLAGVSKMTVYSHFKDKEALFEAFITATADGMLGVVAVPQPGAGLADLLCGVGRSFMAVVVGPEFCAANARLPATLRANHDLALRFYAAGPLRVRTALAAVIASAAEAGELAVDDAMLAAADLVSLWLGYRGEMMRLGLAEPAGPEEIGAMVARGTGVFLRAYRAVG
jgi:TetR/AcrR family transcriptional repressor of mexJK operon